MTTTEPMVPFTLTPRIRHGDLDAITPPGGEVRLYVGKGQTVAAKDTVSYQGQLHLSAGDMIPILQRSILVDVAGYKGLEVLPDAYEITVEDLQATLEWESVKITPETAVIFRTGYYKHFRGATRHIWMPSPVRGCL